MADGRFDYVFSGSMLGTEFKGVRSYPVGSVIEKTMRPMDFEEFCWAIGVQKSTLENIRESCRSVTPIDRYIHDAMMTNFRTYLVVGGMPEVVQRFLDTKGDLAAVRAVQNELNTISPRYFAVRRQSPIAGAGDLRPAPHSAD